MNDIPDSSWDVHVHVFDPIKHPYIADTRYTPPARSTGDLISSIPTKNFVIVMSGPEGTNTALTLEAIEQLREMGRDARGVVVMDLEQMDADEILRLNAAGVRSVRFNTRRDGLSLDELFVTTAKKIHAAGLTWSIEAAIFDIRVWHGLIPTLRKLNKQYGTVFVADHVFAAQPEDLQSNIFQDLLQLVDEGVIFVKISGLTRYGRDPQGMVPLLRSVLSQRQGRAGVFGSDWPNVDSTPGSTRLLPIDVGQHLKVLKEVCDGLGIGFWKRLMSENASILYA